jgi:hypothetical protein
MGVLLAAPGRTVSGPPVLLALGSLCWALLVAAALESGVWTGPGPGTGPDRCQLASITGLAGGHLTCADHPGGPCCWRHAGYLPLGPGPSPRVPQAVPPWSRRRTSRLGPAAVERQRPWTYRSASTPGPRLVCVCSTMCLSNTAALSDMNPQVLNLGVLKNHTGGPGVGHPALPRYLRLKLRLEHLIDA